MPSAPRSRVDRLARILGDAVTALLIAAIALAAFVFYGLLDNRWYHVVAVTGGSMSPSIEAGDLIVITRPPPRVTPGMILTLEVDGSVVTHRVDEVLVDGSFITKGDANTVRDDFSSNVVRVVGEYRLRIPVLGSLLAQARALVSGAWFSVTTDVTTDIGVGLDSWSPAPDELEPAPNDAAAPKLADGLEAGGAGAPEPDASPAQSPGAGSATSAAPQLDPGAPSTSPPAEPAPPAPSGQESAPPAAIGSVSSPPVTETPAPTVLAPTDPPPIAPEPEPSPTESPPALAEPQPDEPDPPGSDVDQ